MVTKIGQVLALAVFFILLPAMGNPAVLRSPKVYILLAIVTVATVYQPTYSPAESGPSGDRGTALQIVWSIYLVLLAAILEAFYLRYPESFAWTPITYAALGVALFGLFLRSWAYVVLGQFFTWHVKTLPEHKVIEDGPYRLVRHPSYTGAFLTYAALPLFFGAYYAFAGSIGGLLFAFVRRIKVEEAELRKTLGAPYADYMTRTGGLFPKLW